MFGRFRTEAEGDDDRVLLLTANAAAVLKRVVLQCTHRRVDPPHARNDKNKEKRTDDVPVWSHEAWKLTKGH